MARSLHNFAQAMTAIYLYYSDQHTLTSNKEQQYKIYEMPFPS